ncbi:hypothetical protein MCEZEM1_00128 [Comamonadaceae bacterium]
MMRQTFLGLAMTWANDHKLGLNIRYQTEDVSGLQRKKPLKNE